MFGFPPGKVSDICYCPEKKKKTIKRKKPDSKYKGLLIIRMC